MIFYASLVNTLIYAS